MNYSALFKNLKDEVAAMRQYNKLAGPFKVFATFITIPFWVLYAFAIITNYVTLFCFNCVAASADYLESWVEGKKKDIHPATEAVLYLVTMQ